MKKMTNLTPLIVLTVILFSLSCRKESTCYNCGINLPPNPNTAPVDNCNISIRPLVNAQLIPTGNLFQARKGIAIASAGNKILFAGGASSSDVYTSSVDIYDVTTNSWSITSLSEAKGFMTTAVLGNKIFFAGGDLGYTFSSRVDIYDVVSNTWTTAELGIGRLSMTAASAGNKVLFAGGFINILGLPPETLRVDIYDAATNSWSIDTLRNRSQPYGIGISATSIGNKIYFAGGAGNTLNWDFSGDFTSTINIYDASTATWSTSQLSQAKGSMAAIAVGNKNIWAGGRNMTFNLDNSHPYLNQVEIMDMNSGTSTFGCLFQPNSNFTVVQKNNAIVFFTSEETWNGLYSTNKFDIYDIVTNSWSIGVLPFSIKAASVISVNNTIYVAGGYVNGVLSNQVWRMDF